jgi:hypothetical protein
VTQGVERLGGAPGPPRPPEEEPYDPRISTDTARVNLAYILTGLLVGIVALSFLILALVVYFPPRAGATSPAITALDSLLKLVFAPVIGLVGSVLGFYFGGRTAKEASREPEGPE